MTELHLENIHHAYGQNHVLHGVSFDVAAGELLCLVGPSGCGKSTLLRLVAGLEPLQWGSIRIGDEVISSESLHMPARLRRIGLVFQHPSLFPHLTVKENISFGLHGKPHAEKERTVSRLLDTIDLEKVALSYPHQLSGGQHQRVALARALAPAPRVMLLDEPFANLDHVLRREMREEVLGMLKEAGVPVMMVTHDPEEALIMADRMVLLTKDGRLHQSGSPHMIHDEPVDIEAAAFFGMVNVLDGEVRNGKVTCAIGEIPAREYAPDIASGSAVKVVTRPEGISLARKGKTGTAVSVERVRHTGVGWRISATLKDGTRVRFHHIHGELPAVGSEARVSFEPPHIFVFKA